MIHVKLQLTCDRCGATGDALAECYQRHVSYERGYSSYQEDNLSFDMKDIRAEGWEHMGIDTLCPRCYAEDKAKYEKYK